MKPDFFHRQIKMPTFAGSLRWLFIKLPTLGRFVRWLFSWRSVRAALFALLACATLVILFYGVENWRGRYAWKKYRADAERRGANFEFKTFLPPQVPDGCDHCGCDLTGIAPDDATSPHMVKCPECVKRSDISKVPRPTFPWW